MNIETISDNKKRCQPQLFLDDEQGAIINRYLKRDGMFVMTDSAWRPVAVAVVTREGAGIAELKDIAAAYDLFENRRDGVIKVAVSIG